MAWITDGDSRDTVTGPTVTCLPNETRGWNPGDGVATAVWNASVAASGKSYWKIKIQSGNDLFVGVTNKKAPEYPRTALLGLYYGGNTTNGREVFCKNYGPWIKAGDAVGVLCDLSHPGRLKLSLELNDKSLGVVFDVERSEMNGELYPVVIFTEKATVAFEECPDIPESPEPQVGQGMEGQWRLEKVTVNNARLDPFRGGCRPPDPFKFELPIRLSLSKDKTDTFSGHLSGANEFPVSLTKDPEIQEYDSWTTNIGSPITNVQVSPEHQTRESDAVQIFQDGQLSITSLGNASLYIEGTSRKSMWTRIGLRYLDGCKQRPADLV